MTDEVEPVGSRSMLRRRALASGALGSGAIWTLGILAIGVGAAERAWYVFHRPLNSDEAIVGLMAREILHGHFSAFYWGQVYGGGETYLVTVMFAVFGQNAWSLEATSLLLSVATSLLAWRIARRIVAERAVAFLVAATVWAGSESAVSNSTIELGFRGLTMVCGLCLVLLALRALDGRANVACATGFGLAAGVGWWSSPEIVYFAIPAALLVVGAVAKDVDEGRLKRWTARAAAALAAAIVGALPWLWNNLNTRFQSLRASAFVVPPHALGYVARLDVFFTYSLPILFDLRKTGSGRWLWTFRASFTVLVVVTVLVVAALVVAALRGGRHLTLVVAVVAFPFVLAISPATWYWRDGRYVDFLVPLLALAVASGANGTGAVLARRSAVPRAPREFGKALLAGALAATIAFCALNFSDVSSPRRSYFAGWRDPNSAVEQVAAKLERAGVRAGYADYWVAYSLDFLSRGHLEITTAGNDPDRWPALNHLVEQSRKTAWLFVRPGSLAKQEFAATRFIVGPGGLAKSTFLGDLDRLHVSYSVVDADLVRAVEPHRTVLPKDVGLQHTDAT